MEQSLRVQYDIMEYIDDIMEYNGISWNMLMIYWNIMEYIGIY